MEFIKVVELGKILYFKDCIKVVFILLSCFYGKMWFFVILLLILVVDRILFLFFKVRMWMIGDLVYVIYLKGVMICYYISKLVCVDNI